jgi:hypothetical protein
MSWPEQRLRPPLGTARAACKGMYGPSTLFIKAIELAERKMTVSPRGGGTPLSELFVVGNPKSVLIGVRRAICSAALMRRLRGWEFLGEQRLPTLELLDDMFPLPCPHETSIAGFRTQLPASRGKTSTDVRCRARQRTLSYRRIASCRKPRNRTVADVVAAGDVAVRFSGLAAAQRFLDLVGRHFERAAHLHATRLGASTAFAGSGTD